jgi:hypothetical protein
MTVMTPELRKVFKKIARMHDRMPRDTISQRARLKARIEACTEDGMIAIATGGTDCDGYLYSHVWHEPAMSVMAFWRMRENWYEGLDGPGDMCVCKPSENPSSSNSYCVWE